MGNKVTCYKATVGDVVIRMVSAVQEVRCEKQQKVVGSVNTSTMWPLEQREDDFARAG